MQALNGIIDINFEVFKILKKEILGNLEILLYKNKKNSEGIILVKFKGIIINYSRTNELEKEYYKLKEIYLKNI